MSKFTKIIFWIVIGFVLILGAVSFAFIYYFDKNLPVDNNTNAVIEESETICEDKCGDNIVQEVVCLVIGCPCAETFYNCPQDCQNKDGIDYETRNISEENSDYSINVSYPQINSADSDGMKKTNNEIKELIDKQIKDFRENISPKDPEMAASFLENNFYFYLLSNNFVSLRFLFVNYASGAAHPMNYSVVFNYDMETGRGILITDLFKFGSDYLGLISQYSQIILEHKLGEDFFADGLLPKQENYQKFVLTEGSVIFLFDPYQVAAYAAGPQYAEIYYYELPDVIDESGVIPEILGQQAWENILNRN